MIWFDRIFPVLMILFPAGYTLFFRTDRAWAKPELPRLQRRLWLGTAAALLLFTAVYVLLFEVPDSEERAAWIQRTWTPLGSLLFFFPLWFGAALPVLRARHPGWDAAIPTTPLRSASLQPRAAGKVILRGAWIAGWLLFVLVAAPLAVLVSQGKVTALSLLVLIFWPVSGVSGAWFSAREPEPLDSRGSPAMLAAYAKSRAFRAWGFYWLGLGLLILSALPFLILGLMQPETSGEFMAWMGSGIGVLGGLGGAVFGILGDLRRVRARRLLHELEAGFVQSSEGPPSAPLQSSEPRKA